MHFCEVTPAQETSYDKFFFQVEQDYKLFHPSYPLVSHLHGIDIEIDRFALRHYYKSVEIF